MVNRVYSKCGSTEKLLEKVLEEKKIDNWAERNGLFVTDYDKVKEWRSDTKAVVALLVFFICLLGILALLQREILVEQMKNCLEVVAQAPTSTKGALELCKAVTVGWWS